MTTDFAWAREAPPKRAVVICDDVNDGDHIDSADFILQVHAGPGARLRSHPGSRIWQAAAASMIEHAPPGPTQRREGHCGQLTHRS
eukprot:5297978-Pyramimonas_sp.AAC.1